VKPTRMESTCDESDGERQAEDANYQSVYGPGIQAQVDSVIRAYRRQHGEEFR